MRIHVEIINTVDYAHRSIPVEQFTLQQKIGMILLAFCFLGLQFWLSPSVIKALIAPGLIISLFFYSLSLNRKKYRAAMEQLYSRLKSIDIGDDGIYMNHQSAQSRYEWSWYLSYVEDASSFILIGHTSQRLTIPIYSETERIELRAIIERYLPKSSGVASSFSAPTAPLTDEELALLKKRAKILSILSYLISALTLFGYLLVTGFSSIVYWQWTGGELSEFAGVFGLFLFFLLMTLALAGMGNALRTCRYYRLAFGSAIFSLLMFPIGTALGIATLVFLNKPVVKMMFKNKN